MEQVCRVIDSSGERVSALDLMKGLINSVWFTIVMTELFTVMGHTQANQEVNDGTYCSFNLSPFPISLFCCHSKHRRTWKSLSQTIPTRSSYRFPNEFSELFDFRVLRIYTSGHLVIPSYLFSPYFPSYYKTELQRKNAFSLENRGKLDYSATRAKSFVRFGVEYFS